MEFSEQGNLGACSYCDEEAFIYRRYSGERLCKSCFISKIEEKIHKTISKYDMMTPDDRIIVAVSGGKDSLTLLYNLMKIQEKTYNSKELIALSLNEGIKGYRDLTIEKAKKFCQRYSISHHIMDVRDYLDTTLDMIISRKQKERDNQNACNFCALIRRRLLNAGAKQLNGDILAMGHNLTDVAETFLMNIFFKRFHKIQNQYFFKTPSSQLENIYIKKIKPLFKIPENEIQLYSKLKDFDYYSQLCPYRKSDPIIRKRVLNIINDFKQSSPEIEFNLVNGFLELSELLYKQKEQKKINLCKKCGYPSGKQDICNFCSLKMEIKGSKEG
ncbi:MAG: TIGR00269 family protein [Promethearchaeia archaeon]